MSAGRRGALLSGAVIVAYLRWVRPWHLRWGATPTQVNMALPGDAEVPWPQLVATRAITIEAPPERVWPWLVQIGYRRAGWYAYDLFDNDGIPSSETILPHLQTLTVGDVIGEEGFAVTEIVANQTLLLTFHHPRTEWVIRRGIWPRFGHCSMCFHLQHVRSGSTHLIVRVRMQCPVPWTPMLAFFEPADFLSQRKMLTGIKRRAEATADDDPGPQAGR